MRRRRLLSVAALLLFATALVAGFVVANALGPEEVRRTAERTLSRALGGPVEVREARLALGGGLAFEAEGLRAWPSGSENGEVAYGLRVERAAARIDPLSLLLGRVRLQRIVMDRATLQVDRHADGSWVRTPVVSAVLGRPNQEGPEPTLWSALEKAGNAARSLLQGPLPILRATLAPQRIELVNARFLLRDARVGEGGAPWTLALEHFTGFLEQDASGREARIGGAGHLVDAQGPCGRVSFQGRRDRGGSVEVAFEAQAVELRSAAPYLDLVHPGLVLEGRVGGRIAVSLASGGARRARIDVLASPLRATIPRPTAGAPFRIEGDTASATAEIDVTHDRLRVRNAHLELGGERYGLDAVAERPLTGHSLARVSLRLQNVDLARARRLASYLPESVERRFAGPLESVDGGMLTELEVMGRGPLDRWQRLADGKGLELHLEGRARFRDLALRSDEGEPLPALAGRVELGSGQLKLQDLRADADLPPIDLTVEGLDALAARTTRIDAPTPPRLPGFATLVEILRGDPDEPVDRSRMALEADLDWIVHPRLRYPVRDLHVEVGAVERGARRFSARGLWGGVPVEVEGHWVGLADSPSARIRVHARASPPSGPPLRRVKARSWARGTWRANDVEVVRVPLARVAGGFYAESSTLRLVEAEAPLLGGGRLMASLAVDLGRADEVPVEISATASRGRIEQLGRIVKLEPGEFIGQVDSVADLAGSLRPGSEAVAQLTGRITLHAQAGELRVHPPVAAALAKLGEPFQDLGSRPFPVTTLRGDLDLAGGQLYSEALLLESPGVRVVASGQVRVDGKLHPIEAVVGVFPERRIDAIVGAVPVIGPFLLGPDDNLLGLYLEVSGPWKSPEAELIRGRTLASGPASFMLEGVPNFVKSGLRAIQSVLVRRPPQRQARGDNGDS